ncbi:MAG: PAS domain S-box protein, partial [Acidobacteriota bacterium]|nr:PAS domain S-box protein [Acidobacteriota bacterium]
DRNAAIGMPLASVFDMRNEDTGERIGVYVPEFRALLVSKNGAKHPIEELRTPIYDRRGAPLGNVLVIRDLSRIRKHEAEIRERDAESELGFRTMADSIPQLAWMAHPDGHIFWYNRRWYEYTGTSLEDMQGWGWQTVHDPAVLPQVLKQWTESIQTGNPFDMVFPLLGADGSFRTFITRVMPIRDSAGKVIRWFGTNTDVTEQQRNEERLRARDERFRRLYEANIVGIICVDAEKVFESNDVFLNMLGFDREDLAAGRLQWAELSGSEEPIALGSGTPFEKELRRKDGSRVPVLFGATLLQREPVQWLGVILDLTERKQLEARVLEAQKLDSVGLLAGGIAHDFNNLLVGVIGNASLAGELVPPGSQAGGLLEQIIRIGDQLAHLTRQLLAYAGKGRFFLEPLDISSLTEGMSELLQPSISKKITFRVERPESLPAIKGDRGQLQQVVTNLVLNAAEAIGNAACTITVRTGVQDLDDDYIDRHLQGAAIPGGVYAYLQVVDTGCGMDKVTKARVFDPFFSTKFTGRGLGMAAVAGIVRGHRGAIAVESSPGKGSCFTVFFPALEETAATAVSRAPGKELRGVGTVVIVDDEPTVRDLAKRALEFYGYQVLLAASAAEAVDIFKRHPGRISAMLLDLSMPSVGGDEILPELHRIRPEVRVVVSSGYSKTETIAQFGSQRIAGFIQKPYTSKDLATAMVAAIR